MTRLRRSDKLARLATVSFFPIAAKHASVANDFIAQFKAAKALSCYLFALLSILDGCILGVKREKGREKGEGEYVSV